jgi:hypothetical protein
MGFELRESFDYRLRGREILVHFTGSPVSAGASAASYHFRAG